ncbi:GMC family oxidoreductase [Actinokineospora pegani]|uniref:GMC family oxidoreductase n=1 Tax=Actinokineospora pegani TaxID=2654637 RepID=UPI0018D31905|nr:GMC family oxidoreductase N-terminal domain-containing protein [Actinokineospora pegani]
MRDGYDYVVVGAGSAGCAVAARLSADPGVSVVLLEAGPHDDVPEVRTPFAAVELFGSERDWAYTTAPQTALGGRGVAWPRGRVLGGSSSLNFQMWLPGHPADAQDWAAAGWTAADLADPLRAVEGWTGEPGTGLGAAGPLRLAPPRDPDPSSHAFLAACAQTGIGPVVDWTAARGAGLVPLTQHDGRRWSAADAFLKPVLDRDNLDVVTDVEVSSVVVVAGRATGVVVDGRELRAHREVVVCAGTVGSPVLLRRSGIGDAARSRAAGLPVVADLPGVGANLRDHVVVDVVVGAHGPSRFTAASGPAARAAYETSGTGPLSSNVAEAAALLRLDGGDGPPDLELIWCPLAFGPEGPEAGFTLPVVLLRPRSAGRVDLAGDPAAPPVVDPAYLTDPADVAAVLAGIRRAGEVLDAPALARVVSTPDRPWELGDAELAEYARSVAATMYHPVGTCRVGGADDPGAVVDPALRVRGVDGLRVADASVVPATPRGHTHATAVAVGQRAAALIAGEPAVLPAR